MKIDLSAKIANFNVLSIKGGKVVGGNYQVLKINGQDYVDLSFSKGVAGIVFSVNFGSSSTGLNYHEQQLEIAAGNAKDFDMKLGTTLPAGVLTKPMGNNTGLGLIGGQDTRGNVTEAFYVSANLSDPKIIVRVKLKVNNTGNVFVVFGSQTADVIKLEDKTKYPIKNMGILNWGCHF